MITSLQRTRMRNVIDRRSFLRGNGLNLGGWCGPIWKWRVVPYRRIYLFISENCLCRTWSRQYRMNLLFSCFTLGGFKTASPFAVRCLGKTNKQTNKCRRASIPGGSAHTAGIHLQSSVQRVAGQKVRGGRRMLLDVCRMRPLSGTLSSVFVCKCHMDVHVLYNIYPCVPLPNCMLRYKKMGWTYSLVV